MFQFPFLWRGYHKWFLFDSLPIFKLNKGVFPCTRSYPLPISLNLLLPIRGDNAKIVRMTLAICERLHGFMGTQREKKSFQKKEKLILLS